MNNNGQQWTTLDNNGQQWTTMDNNGQQWTTMDNNGQQWTTMDNNGQQSAVLHASQMPACRFKCKLLKIHIAFLRAYMVTVFVAGQKEFSRE